MLSLHLIKITIVFVKWPYATLVATFLQYSISSMHFFFSEEETPLISCYATAVGTRQHDGSDNKNRLMAPSFRALFLES